MVWPVAPFSTRGDLNELSDRAFASTGAYERRYDQYSVPGEVPRKAD
jgi:hypothetical protein